MADGLKPRAALTTAFIMAACLYATLCCMFADFWFIPRHSPLGILNGTAEKPFVYRQLVPLLAHGIIFLTPDTWQQAMENLLSDTLRQCSLWFADGMRFYHYPSPPASFYQGALYPLMVLAIIDYLFLLGYAYMLQRLASRLFPALPAAHTFAPLIGILAIVPFCSKYAYIYDFPTLFFSAWLTLLLLEKRWRMFTAAIALATLNKETSIYVILLFALFAYRQMPLRHWSVYIGLQLALYAVVKLALTIYYADSPGAVLENHFAWQLAYLFKGYDVHSLIALVASLALFGYRWADKPYILKCWLALSPLVTLAYLLFGHEGEYRAFYEIFPALTLLATHTLAIIIHSKKIT